MYFINQNEIQLWIKEIWNSEKRKRQHRRPALSNLLQASSSSLATKMGEWSKVKRFDNICMSISFWENIYQVSKYKKKYIVAGISEYLHEYQNVEGYLHQYQNVKENLHKYQNMEEYLLVYSNLRRSEFLTLICIWILSNWFRACTEVFAWFMSLLNLIKSWYFLLFKTTFCSLKLFVV